MKLSQRLKIKERQVRLARAAFTESYADAKRVLYRRLSSRTALVMGFSSGLALGWVNGKRRPASRSLSKRVRTSLPRHWLGNYFIWPVLLGTARDLVVGKSKSLTTSHQYGDKS